MDVISVIRSYLKKTENERIIEGQSKDLALWECEYQGYNPSFHEYKIYRNDGTWLNCVKKSLKAGKMVASDWASLVVNEKTKIVIDSTDQDKLNDILKKNHFWSNLQNYIEMAYAMSISAAILTINGISINEAGVQTVKTGTPKINFLKPKQVYPITIDNGEITECAFACENTNYTEIVIYILNEQNKYEIHSLHCKKNTRGSLTMPDGQNINVFPTNDDKRWFAIFKPAIANNIDLDSNLPISIYANSIDTLHAIDNKYDGFDSEYQLGKRRIFVETDYLKEVEMPKADGSTETTYVPVFDNNDVVFHSVPKARGETGGRKIESIADPLREQSYINGINQELTYLAKQCGFGTNRYIFQAGGRPIQTATGVISQNSELYQNKIKQENYLAEQLVSFTLAITSACNTYTDIPFKEYTDTEISVVFKDSVIEDEDSQMKRDKENVLAGLMSIADFITKWTGKDNNDSIEYIVKNLRWKLLNDYATAYSTGMITTKELMKCCYPDFEEGTEEYDETYTQLEENKKAANAAGEFNSLFNGE